MTGWTSEELDRIGTAQELQVASLRADGTLRQPVTIWVIREGDDLYVRSWRGRSGAWYRGVQERHGVDKDVDFIAVDDEELNQLIDAAYRAKYGRYGSSYVEPMTSGETRTTTLRLEPRAAKGAA
ncbi:MAG TPA: DUF2255 family protein [Solirubrobacteraceae bacterium]|nr:DUF2255 family protein [Solirubrobacteraceae bacterium]